MRGTERVSGLTPAHKVDRDEVFLEYTKSICAVCKVVVDAEINARDYKIRTLVATSILRHRNRRHLLAGAERT